VIQLTANRQFDDFAPVGEHPLRGDEPQLIAAFDRLGVTALVFEDTRKQAPQMVNQQQHVYGTLADHCLLRTEPGKAPRVLEFIKDVLGIHQLLPMIMVTWLRVAGPESGSSLVWGQLT
jgi:hypothetical protein